MCQTFVDKRVGGALIIAIELRQCLGKVIDLLQKRHGEAISAVRV